jgi:RNA polymerase sigma-70 factor (ECF subfamily)
VNDERAWVEGLRRGRVEAFDAVYAAYRPRVFAFLVRLTGQPPLAEDLLQEVFLRLARYAPRLSEDTQLSAWLFTVARNLYFSHRRWSLLDIARVSELRLWSQLGPPPPTPLAALAASETQARLEQGLSELPLAYREVVLLCAVEGLSPSEAAQVIGVEPAALRKRLSRARAMLKQALQRHEDKP